jgi:hypothetical protein
MQLINNHQLQDRNTLDQNHSLLMRPIQQLLQQGLNLLLLGALRVKGCFPLTPLLSDQGSVLIGQQIEENMLLVNSILLHLLWMMDEERRIDRVLIM